MIDPREYPPIAGVQVIGFVGAARHGKDELAKMIMRSNIGAERFAFSDLLAAHLRLIGAMTTRDTAKLQRAGIEVDRDCLCRAMYGWIEDKAPAFALVTGIRYASDADLIRAMGGRIISVKRIEADGRPFVDPDRDPNHPIETFIPAIRHDVEVIACSGDLCTLEMMAARLVAA